VSSSRQTQGQALAALGGVGLAASLWLPWYSIQIPQAAVNSISQSAQQLGALAPLVRTGAQLINELGPFHITAWQAFTTTPAVLLAVAIIAGGLAALALTERAGDTSQLTMLAGGVGAVLVGYRIAVPPGQGSFVHPAWGIYLALISALLMLAGGGLSGRDDGQTIPAMTMPNPNLGYGAQSTVAGWSPGAGSAGVSAISSSPGQSGAATGWSDSPPQTHAVAGWSGRPVSSPPTGTWSSTESVSPPAP
jgi:hypothetical protein